MAAELHSLVVYCLSISEKAYVSPRTVPCARIEVRDSGTAIERLWPGSLHSLQETHHGPLPTWLRFNWREKARKMVDNATIHWSVYERVKLPRVLVYDQGEPYHPVLLAVHKGLRRDLYQGAQASETPSAV